jgi:hypothetical protein
VRVKESQTESGRERESETDESSRSGFGILAASPLALVENRRRSSEELLQFNKVPTATATVSDESDLPDFRAEGPSLAGTRAATLQHHQTSSFRPFLFVFVVCAPCLRVCHTRAPQYESP